MKPVGGFPFSFFAVMPARGKVGFLVFLLTCAFAFCPYRAGQLSLRMPKEATCDVECAMKVESLRILTKKRKQQQKSDSSGAATSSPGGTGSGKGVKRAFPGSTGNDPSLDCGTASSSDTSDHSKASLLTRGANKDNKDSSRRRFVWSVPLHQDFVAAVFDIGLKCASPKLLLEMMPVVDGLTSEHIKSHLQKYRLHRQRSREEFLKSYGYLTDLDGGKGLGGGSAAAAIKAAAAAAASEMKGSVPRRCSDPVSVPQRGDCDMKCACHNGAASASATAAAAAATSTEGGGENVKSPDAGETPANIDRQEGEAPSKISTAGNSEKVSEVDDTEGMSGTRRDEQIIDNDHDGDKEAEGSPGSTQAGGTETAANDPPQQIDAGNVEAVTGTLVQSHLALLARGINMQIRFHHHLRQVVESQQRLQVEFLGRQQGYLSPPPRQSDADSPSVITSTADTSVPSTIGPSPMDQPAGVLRESESSGSPRDEGLVGTAGFLGGIGGLSNGSVYASTAPGSMWKMAGMEKTVSEPTSLAESVAEANGITGVSSVASSQSKKPGSSSVHALTSNVTLASAAAGTTHASGDASRNIASPGNLQYGSQMPDATSRHFNPQAIPPAHSRGQMGGRAMKMSQRGYGPGEYTHMCRISGAVASGEQPHARGSTEAAGVRAGSNPGISLAHSRADAHAAVVATAGLVTSATPTGAVERTTMALKHHMQAQMDIHGAMLSGCTGQSNHGGAEHFMGASRGLPSLTHISADGGSNGRIEAAEASGDNSEAGGAGGSISGGGRLGVSGATGSSHHPQDGMENSALLGLMQDSEMLDLNWLDRGGELKPGEHQPPAAARQAGDEQPSLLAYLME